MSNWDELKTAAAYLGEHVGVLTDSDQRFARSLIEQFAERGLSEKQEYWVIELAKRARERLARQGKNRKPGKIGDNNGVPFDDEIPF